MNQRDQLDRRMYHNHIDHLWTKIDEHKVRIDALRKQKRKAELACDLWAAAAVIQVLFILWQYV